MTKADKQIEDFKKQLADLENKWKRALADYQNLERRIENQRQDIAKFAAKDLILKLLAVGDNLNLAVRHVKDQGLDLAVRHFWQVLEGEGLKKIEVEGKNFDPNEMECVEVVEGEKEGKVVSEVRSGYYLGDRVLRVAQVRVLKKKIDKKAEELAKEELQKGDYM